MKKETIIFAGLVALTCTLFSFEFMVNHKKQELTVSSYNASDISTIAFDVSANVFFIEGDENKIILEGTPLALEQIELNSKSGHFALKKHSKSVLFNFQSIISSDAPINMYIISENLDNIRVFNQNGCLANKTLFNGDRGILEVNNLDVIQFANAKVSNDYKLASLVCLEKKTPSSLTSCL